jgi:hypothetical protein
VPEQGARRAAVAARDHLIGGRNHGPAAKRGCETRGGGGRRAARRVIATRGPTAAGPRPGPRNRRRALVPRSACSPCPGGRKRSTGSLRATQLPRGDAPHHHPPRRGRIGSAHWSGGPGGMRACRCVPCLRARGRMVPRHRGFMRGERAVRCNLPSIRLQLGLGSPGFWAPATPLLVEVRRNGACVSTAFLLNRNEGSETRNWSSIW